MIDLVTKKRIASFKSVDNARHYNAITSPLLVEKKEDPRMVMISCIIGSLKYIKALYELSASINLMPL